jgi:hypothetical protein
MIEAKADPNRSRVRHSGRECHAGDHECRIAGRKCRIRSHEGIGPGIGPGSDKGQIEGIDMRRSPYEKGRLGRPLIRSYSLLSEYQVEVENLPNLFAMFGAEVLCFIRSLLWIFGLGLDKFSTG